MTNVIVKPSSKCNFYCFLNKVFFNYYCAFNSNWKFWFSQKITKILIGSKNNTARYSYLLDGICFAAQWCLSFTSPKSKLQVQLTFILLRGVFFLSLVVPLLYLILFFMIINLFDLNVDICVCLFGHLSFYSIVQYYLLDVAAVFIAIVLIMVHITRRILRFEASSSKVINNLLKPVHAKQKIY